MELVEAIPNVGKDTEVVEKEDEKLPEGQEEEAEVSRKFYAFKLRYH